mmetsp:Transcript_36711/g.117740  ORF Transcript_36711/g.117740 Transcript_36711/m.117740 type:complete len:290 (+) Transcript_36711:131-1000(+)
MLRARRRGAGSLVAAARPPRSPCPPLPRPYNSTTQDTTHPTQPRSLDRLLVCGEARPAAQSQSQQPPHGRQWPHGRPPLPTRRRSCVTWNVTWWIPNLYWQTLQRSSSTSSVSSHEGAQSTCAVSVSLPGARAHRWKQWIEVTSALRESTRRSSFVSMSGGDASISTVYASRNKPSVPESIQTAAAAVTTGSSHTHRCPSKVMRAAAISTPPLCATSPATCTRAARVDMSPPPWLCPWLSSPLSPLPRKRRSRPRLEASPRAATPSMVGPSVRGLLSDNARSYMRQAAS